MVLVGSGATSSVLTLVGFGSFGAFFITLELRVRASQWARTTMTASSGTLNGPLVPET